MPVENKDPNLIVISPEHVDPVCGMTVDPDDSAGSHHYKGKTYYFCNPSCLERFKKNPDTRSAKQPPIRRARIEKIRI
jgi:YHS domain-containing protein